MSAGVAESVSPSTIRREARCRCHPTLSPGQARAMCVNHAYGRGGAPAYPATYDVHQATVFGRCGQRTGIGPFMALVAQVMTQEPYAGAKRVFWIVDNGSSHRVALAPEPASYSPVQCSAEGAD